MFGWVERTAWYFDLPWFFCGKIFRSDKEKLLSKKNCQKFIQNQNIKFVTKKKLNAWFLVCLTKTNSANVAPSTLCGCCCCYYYNGGVFVCPA